MKRRDTLQPGYRSRGRGRRRTAPLPPFDAVPPHLVEAAKRIFAQRPRTGHMGTGSGQSGGGGPSSDGSEGGPTGSLRPLTFGLI
jgi:hypothetical protein